MKNLEKIGKNVEIFVQQNQDEYDWQSIKSNDKMNSKIIDDDGIQNKELNDELKQSLSLKNFSEKNLQKSNFCFESHDKISFDRVSSFSEEQNENAEMMIRFFENLKCKIDTMSKNDLCFEFEYFIDKLEKQHNKFIDIDYFLSLIHKTLEEEFPKKTESN